MNIELTPEEIELIRSALWTTLMSTAVTESEMKDIGSLYAKLVSLRLSNVQKMERNLLT
jgi:hypothetical protein